MTMTGSQPTTTALTVSGMTCGHCVNAVTEEVSAVPGVQSLNIELVAGGESPVTVLSDGALDRAAVEAAVAEAGDYTVTW